MAELRWKGGQGVWSLVKTVVSWLSAALAIGLMIFAVLSSCFLGGDGASLLGYRFFSVQSDSMAATDFATGDVIISKEVEPSTLKEGDIITFVSQNWGSFGETVTHKIRRRVVDPSGNPGFITYGTTTDSDDETVVTYEYIIGQYQGRIPKIGTLFEFIKTAPGMLLCLFIPFVLVLFIHGSILVRSMTLWQKERLRVAEQRNAVYAEMLEALTALEEQMADPADPAEPTDSTDPAETTLLNRLQEIVRTAQDKLDRIEEDGENAPLDASAAEEEPAPDSMTDP